MQKKVLMINRLESTFIRKDYDLLKKNYDVELIQPPKMSSKEYPGWCIANLFSAMVMAYKCDYIYSWWCTSTFASIVGKLTGTKVILVAGGYDTVKDTNLKYGAFVNKKLAVLTKMNMQNAYKILCVGSNLISNIQEIDKKLVSKCDVVPTGYDKKFWNNEFINRISKTTVCVNSGSVAKARIRHMVKGIDRFVEMARTDVDNVYTIVGYEDGLLEKLEGGLPQNVIVIEKVDRYELKNIYNHTKLYLQLSRHEGYPNSVCEALLCGCDVKYSKEVCRVNKCEIINIEDRLELIKKVMI